MRDSQLLAQFEDGSLAEFHHREHIHVAWLYLERWPLHEVLERFPRAIRHFAECRGLPELYHETITWAYLLLIHERRARLGPGHSFYTFAEENTDLLDWERPLLNAYYSKEAIRSELAKRVFVLPQPAFA